jgi:hypothetical protein
VIVHHKLLTATLDLIVRGRHARKVNSSLLAVHFRSSQLSRTFTTCLGSSSHYLICSRNQLQTLVPISMLLRTFVSPSAPFSAPLASLQHISSWHLLSSQEKTIGNTHCRICPVPKQFELISSSVPYTCIVFVV